MEILNWFNLGFCNDVGLVHFLLRFYSLGSIARSTAILARIEEASSATFLGTAKSQVHAPSWFIFHVLKFGCALSILKLILLPWIIASLTASYLNLFSTISVGAASLTASCLNHFSTFSVGANIGSKNIFFGLSSRCHKSNSILPFSLSFTRLPLLCFFCFGSLVTTILFIMTSFSVFGRLVLMTWFFVNASLYLPTENFDIKISKSGYLFAFMKNLISMKP